MSECKLFITGITGTVGRAVLDFVSEQTPQGAMSVKRGWSLFGLASGESKIKELEKLYRDPDTTQPNPKLRLYATDLSDQAVVHHCVSEADAVIHTAAKKHVDYVQRAPLGAFHTNVYGTLLLSEACGQLGKRLVFMSSDKAVAPVGFYGWTKHIAEQIVLGLDHRMVSEEAPRAAGTVVRSGNIAASSGSIFTIWYREAQRGFVSRFGEGHTRYVIEREALAKVLIEAATSDWRSKIVVPAQMELWDMDGLAEALAEWLRVPVKLVSRKAVKGGVPEKREEAMYTAEEARAGRVFLWDEAKGLRPAPLEPPWKPKVPGPDAMERLWHWAAKEAERTGA